MKFNGGVAERLIAAVLKTAVPERVPGVRIPAPPQSFVRNCSELFFSKMDLVAQLVRASVCGTEGRGFSRRDSYGGAPFRSPLEFQSLA